jgi:hypothetical protein
MRLSVPVCTTRSALFRISSEIVTWSSDIGSFLQRAVLYSIDPQFNARCAPRISRTYWGDPGSAELSLRMPGILKHLSCQLYWSQHGACACASKGTCQPLMSHNWPWNTKIHILISLTTPPSTKDCIPPLAPHGELTPPTLTWVRLDRWRTT